MRTLPKPLAHARALIDLLPPDLAQPLWELVERVGRALGNFPADTRSGHEEPDGYEGLGREAQYERLLMSEWLLAEELPDEFLRRASAGEHAFLALARRQPRSKRACTVLLDSGPFMLGMPRIVALATLVALERRARAVDADFRWSTLGSGLSPHLTIDDEADVRAFLDARRRDSPQPQDLEPLLADAKGDDLWVVGATRTTSWARHHAHTVTLNESLTCREVVTHVQPRGRAARTLALPMPDEAVCVRLLRDPFEQRNEPALPDRAQLGRAWIFAGRGHRLLEVRDSALLGHCIPAHPGGKPGKTKTLRFPQDENVLAVAYVNRLVAITVSGESVNVYGLRQGTQGLVLGRHGALRYPLNFTNKLVARDQPHGCVFLDGGKQFVAFVPLKDGSTLSIGQRDAVGAYVVSQEILGFAEGGKAGQWVWLTSQGDLLELRLQILRSAEWDTVARLELTKPDDVFFACPRERTDATGGYVAVRHGDRVRLVEIRSVGSSLNTQDLFKPRDAQLVGLFLARDSHEPQMVIWSHDRKRVESIGRSSGQTFVQSSTPLERVQVCAASSLLSYSSATQTTLYCMRNRRVLWVIEHRENDA